MEMERRIGLLGKKVSNIEKCIDLAIEFSSKLAIVWESGDYRVKREIQDLVFPGGMYYNRQKDQCRTGRVNEVSCIAHQQGILTSGNSNSGSVFDVNYDWA